MAQSHRLKQTYTTLRESERWPRERLRDWQRRHLASLVLHARAGSPFYRFRLDKLMSPGGTIDWARWTEVPIVTREDASRQYQSLLTRRPVADHGPFAKVSTSGSTGDPVTVMTTRWLNDLSAACQWRAQAWAGLNWAETVVESAQGVAGDDVGRSTGPWGPPWSAMARKGRRILTDYLTPAPQRLDLIRKHRAAYVGVSVSGLHTLLDAARDSAQNVRIQRLFFRGAALTDQLRQETRVIFGAEVLELYSSKEAGSIAHRCSHGQFHVNDEAVLLEIVDDAGQPVAPGQEGRVIVTPFASTAFPLIRYDQGDRAVAGDTCSCGISLTSIASISGRTKTMLRRPDGSTIGDLPLEARKLLGAGLWQVAKVAAHTYELRYTTRDWGQPPDPEAFKTYFLRHYYPEATVRLRPVANIPLSPTGKFDERVVEWTGD